MLRSVIAGAAQVRHDKLVGGFTLIRRQPTAAKIADVFGRLELILVSIVFHIVGEWWLILGLRYLIDFCPGTVIEATSHGVKGFAAGAVFYQVGYTCATLLAEVIIADMTSLRSRLFFSYTFASPYLVRSSSPATLMHC